MRFLKQSTSVDLPIGPFVDSTDGFTAETALTLTQPDIRLKKNAAAWGQKAAAQTLTHEENGNYEVTLDATDTDTLGQLRLHVNETGALPVWEEFMVMPANVWDSLFGADKLQTDVAEWLGTAAATPTVAGVPEVDVTHVAGATADVSTMPASVAAILVDTGTTLDARIPAALVSGRMDASVGAMAAGVIAAATFAANALDAVWSTATRLLTAGTNIVLAKGTGVTGFNDLSAAQVNAEAVDSISVDTRPEPGQEAPPATISMARKVDYLYKGFRNRFVQNNTAGTALLYADDGTTVDHRGTVADDGVTFDKGELGSGP